MTSKMFEAWKCQICHFRINLKAKEVFAISGESEHVKEDFSVSNKTGQN